LAVSVRTLSAAVAVLAAIFSVLVVSFLRIDSDARMESGGNTVYMMIGSNLAVTDRRESVPIDPDRDDAAPFVDNGAAYVPLRFTAEFFGAYVRWNEAKSITVMLKDNLVRTWNGSQFAILNDETVRLDETSRFIDGAVFVPARSFFSLFGLHVEYRDGVVSVSETAGALSAVEFEPLKNALSAGLPFRVYQDERFVAAYATLSEAKTQALLLKNASVRSRRGERLWENFSPYVVMSAGEPADSFDTFAEAKAYASLLPEASVIHQPTGTHIRRGPLHPNRIGGVPLIGQFPELPRGCEVTSLAMLLNFYGVRADKMELADAIRKLPFRTLEQGTWYYADPNEGFAGDMYSYANPGLGVYHAPIAELAETYAPGKVIDMTGAEFEEVLYQVSEGRPVWVIITSTYDVVPEREWMTWKTRRGTVKVTYKQHSVVITGFDDRYVYVHDPYLQNTRLDLQKFRAGWEQIGRQAIIIAD